MRARLLLFAALAVDATGGGLFVPVSLLYFASVTGLPLTTVGPLLSAATLASLPVPAMVGHLAGRFRPRDIVVASQIVQACGFAGYLLVRDATTMLVAAVFVMVGQRAFWSAFFAMIASVGDTDPRQADRSFARVGMVQMGGMGLGSLLGGLAAAAGHYRPLVMLNALSFAVAAVLLLMLPRGSFVKTTGGGYRALLRDRPFLLLIGANTLFTLCSFFLGVALPVYLVDGLPGFGWLVGPLLAVNTVVLALAQDTAVRLVRPLSRAVALAVAGGIWVVWCLTYAAASVVPRWAIVPCLAGGLLCYAAADVIHAPVSNAFAAAVAPPAERGRYLAVFQYGWVVAQIVAPSFFTLLYARGHALPWLALAVLAAVASALVQPLRGLTPAADSPAADSPAADSPAADSPAADSPATDSPVAGSARG